MPDIMSTNGLVAPADAGLFTLAYLLLAIAPGYAVATWARPSAPRLERVAVAIPCAYALVVLCGLVTALLRLPFGLPAYAVVAVPAVALGIYARFTREYRSRGQRDVPPGTAGILPARSPGVPPGTAGVSPAHGPGVPPGTAGVSPARGSGVPPGTTGILPAYARGDDAGAEPHDCPRWRGRQAAIASAGGPSGYAAELGRWWLAPAGVALIQLVNTVLVYAHDTTPGGFDTPVHVMWTEAIARAHIFPIALLSAHIGDNASGAFYPPAFHALNALVLAVAPVAPYRAVFYSVVAAMTVLPLSLFAYVRAATGSARLGGLATVAALAFEPLPYFTQEVGIYPFLVAMLFIPAIAVALRDGLGHGDRRAVALAALLGTGLFYTHPTEFVTAGLLTLAILPGALRDRRAWLRAGGYGLLVAVAWAVAAAPALVAVHRTMATGAQSEIAARHSFTTLPRVDLPATLSAYIEWIYGRNLSYALLIATVLGVAWCVARRRHIGLAVAYAIVFLLFMDVTSYNILRPFYVISFPWAYLERITPTHYWFVLPLAAIGLDAVIRAAGARLRQRDPVFRALVASPLVVLGLALPFGVMSGRIAAYAGARRVAAPSDLGAIAWLARHAPPGAVVLNDGSMAHLDTFDPPIDAGRWMDVLGGPQAVFARGAALGAPADRLYLARHIADAPLPPRAAAFVDRYHVRYVFYGAAVRPDATRHLNLPRLLADPRLTLAYASPPRCTAAHAHDPAACPTVGSYVFALRPTTGVASLAHGQ